MEYVFLKKNTNLNIKKESLDWVKIIAEDLTWSEQSYVEYNKQSVWLALEWEQKLHRWWQHLTWLVSGVPIIVCGTLFQSANSTGFCTPLTVLVTRPDVCQQTRKAGHTLCVCGAVLSIVYRLICFSDHFTVWSTVRALGRGKKAAKHFNVFSVVHEPCGLSCLRLPNLPHVRNKVIKG